MLVVELALLVYLSGLVIGLRVYPKIASKVVGVAAVARRILVDRTKLGWLFPVLLLWIIERTIVSLAFQGLGLDYGDWQDMEIERGFLNAILPVDVEIPESSFLDLLVALSLLPMAIFTTMAGFGDRWPAEGTGAFRRGLADQHGGVTRPCARPAAI